MIPTRKLVAALAGAVLLAATPALLSQEAAPATIRVLCVADAIVEIDGVKTTQTGAVRRFATPNLAPGKKFFYQLKASWKEEGKDQSKEEKVAVEAGKETAVDLRPTPVAKVEPIKTEPKKEPVTKKEEPKKEEPKKEPVVVKKEEPKKEPVVKKPYLDVPYVPTPQEVVDEMLKLAGVTKDDVVYDLGCGDGRIVVSAAKLGAKGVGIDLDPVRVAESKANVKAAKVEKLAEIREGNALKVQDLGKASVVTLYLLPDVNLQLRPQLLKDLKPGSRVVSHAFDMGDWQADKHVQVKDKEGQTHNLFLWNVGETKKEVVKKEDKKDPKFDDPKYIFVPTPDDVVNKMLELGKVGKDDVVYDLGCGNGIIVATAAKKYGCKAVGVDINPVRVKESNDMVKKMKVEKLVEIREGDVLQVKDLNKASVLCLYLLPDLLKQLEPKFKSELKPGTRIVSHDFLIGEWKPDQEVSFSSESGRDHMLYVWTVPDPKAVAKVVPDRKPDVHYVPTPQEVVDKMLEVAKVGKNDVVYDLGCGDGRIVVTAAKKLGAKGVGYDIDPERIKDSNKNVKDNKVEKQVTIKHADIFQEDLSGASVITLYLLPRLNVKLVPQLEKLKPGTRIVSHDFDIKGYKPKDTIRIMAKDDQGNEDVHMIYLFTIPLEKE